MPRSEGFACLADPVADRIREVFRQALGWRILTRGFTRLLCEDLARGRSPTLLTLEETFRLLKNVEQALGEVAPEWTAAFRDFGMRPDEIVRQLAADYLA